ncbi:hypothetical protein C3B59_15645 [Cryobacterium zongtaii]|uniref:Uncharacterized protein n=1 Tax=Cryobacterium zongtaii TaxID=1259217 RepID=A0A2S3Z8X7_9MICO|nr:hypothetical protein C3B59_15645 [Cryobacterium zongtaii]
MRGARVIEPGSAPSGSAPARSADAGTPASGTSSPAREATVVRPRGSVRAQEPVSAAAADDAPIENASGRRRLVMIGSIAAAVLLIGAVVAAVTLTGIDNSALTPTASPVPAKPDSVNSAAGVPAPVLEGTATSEDGSQVTFTVSNPSPSDGDVYRWARAETPNQPKLSTVADITVDGVVPGSTVCVDIYLQRTDGKISEANRACNR